MSGRWDPTRLVPRNYTAAALDSWLRMITKERIAEDWQFGLAPYNRKYPPPQVCFLALLVCCLRDRPG